MNKFVYSKLSVATVAGTAHHLVKQHEDDKNKYTSWNALCEWYDGDSVKNKTSDYLRSKLENYRLILASKAAQYINNFFVSEGD